MKIKNLFAAVLILITAWSFQGCQSTGQQDHAAPDSLRGEIMYHIFQRSFYDSNGDLDGDFNGIREKLDYLQQLGVTALLLTPIVQSVYYHNYFADDFEKIDSAYGTMDDWLRLVEAVHRRGMKIYLDQEFQYVTLKQKWFKDSYKNPRSKYSRYIIYHDSANTRPEPIIYNISHLEGYNDSSREVATVNLYDPGVQEYFYNLLKHWMDPDGDGDFKDGVDGFRLDHMMDDLDNKGVLTHLFARFWCPLITKLRAVNPKVIFLAEQAEWADFGWDYLQNACVDRVFAFNLRNAIVSFDKKQIAAMADSTFGPLPPGKEQIVFLENHDLERFASAVNHNPGKLRVGAALNLLIGGIPSIYYGQELGMAGKGGFGRFGNTDGNDIPQREAFEWYKADTGNGMALWYKNTGPWWDSTNLHPDDGISLQEERKEAGSLWNYYRQLTRLYHTHDVFSKGKYAGLENNSDSVVSFIRYTKDKAAIVAVNLSAQEQHVTIDVHKFPFPQQGNNQFTTLMGETSFEQKDSSFSLQLPAYKTGIWEVSAP